MKTFTARLYLKYRNELFAIDVDQCSPLMEPYKGGRGVSEMPYSCIDLYDDNGKRIGEISYNGRIWLDTGDGKIEVPREGRPTAKELFG